MKHQIADAILYVEIDGELEEVVLEFDQQVALLEKLNEMFSVDVEPIEQPAKPERKLKLIEGGKD